MNYLLKLELLVMVLFLSTSLFSQAILEKPITLECNRLSITEIIDSINVLSGVNFTYVKGVLPEGKKVSINVENTSLKSVLSKVLKGTGVKYKIVNEQIVFYDTRKISPTTKKFSISGHINSKGKPLSTVQITIIETQNSTLTDDNGFFNIKAPEGIVKINVLCLGYKEITRKVEVTEDMILNIKLKPRNNLPMVTVVVDSPGDSLETIPSSVTRYDVKKLKQMPPVGGEADALQFMQLIPGIQSGNEGAGGIFVRGGSIDQNQIIMEGNTIYNPSHLFGLFSVFNTDAIQNIDLTKNAIPARYGERLSSVLDIKLKDANNRQMSGSASIGTMLSKIYLELPVYKKSTSLLIAGRKSMTEFGLFTYNKFKKQKTNELLNYGFFDYNVKLVHNTAKKGKISVSLFQARDWLKLNDIESLFTPQTVVHNSKDRLRWGNWSESIRYSSNPNKKIVTHCSLNYSTYAFKLNEEFTNTANPDPGSPELKETHKYNASLSDLNIKYNMDFLKGEDINFKVGVIGAQKLFRPGIKTSKFKNETTSIVDTIFNNRRIETNEISSFVESNLKFGNRVHLNIGVRQSWFHTIDTSFLSFQPRLAMKVDVSRKISWNSSLSHITQFLHLLTNTGIGLPSDIWVPSTKEIQPQRNLQYASGIAYNLNSDFKLSLEGFYKKQFNLITYDIGSKFLIDSKNWEKNVNVGEGRAYGAEFFLEKSGMNFTGWLGYTLSWSNRRFDHINNGLFFPFKFDRRHDISMVGLYNVNDAVKLSFSWVFSSGNLTTIPTSVITVTNPNTNETSDVYIYDEWNNHRMKSFHRLNLGIELHKEKANFLRIIKINLYNAYNRKNPFYVTVEKDNRTNEILYRQISLFPIIPSFSYEYKF